MRPGRIAYLLLAVSGLTALAVAYGMNPPGAPDDNFLAYKTKISKGTPKFQPRLGLHLVDAWEDQFYDAGAAAGLFVPATANGQGIADAETYLQAYKIKALRGYRHTKRSGVLVTNEVGTISLDTKGRDLLLVPTAEDLDSSPSSPNPQFHNVDHFKCYRVGVTKGTAPFPRGISISVDDQLATDERRLALTRPQHLCVPVDKNDEGIKNPTGLLLCYAAKLLPGAPKHQRQLSLRINNQFGPLTLDSVKETEFCVPSVSGSVPTPMATQAPTPTPAQAGCGDGSLQANEVCDVGVLSGQNCSSLGYVGGALSCARTCNGFDSSNCTLPASPPSDPTLSAPPLDPSVAMDIKTASSFLYSGASRVQYGVTADTIEAIRAAVLRGSVSTQDGAPLAGVVVSIHGHPEFGQAVTRTDGRFDLVVNGGGALSVDYKKPGFLISQRHVAVPWQEYTEVPPVGMVAKDPIATQVNLRGNSTAMQVALGSTRSDSRGSRTAVVMFPRGTRASIIVPDGSSQLVPSLSIRLTEYTVGANNTAAMPAALPSLTSYTYAVELGADEAVTKVGGQDVVFDRPVVSYTDNFIDLPVGLDIPAGYYDRDAAAWIPSRNGRVVKIVGVAGELAKIDLTGSGEAASDAALEEFGIDTDERRELAGRYAIGKSLWRVPLTHFSTYDFNFGSQPKPPPPHPDPQPKPNPDDPCQSPHSSTIECQTQVLKEEVPIAGTPYTLNYSSSRVPAYAPPIAIPLTGSAVSSAALRVELEINVAGQRIRKDFAPTPDQTYDFQWDGRDGYGRMVQGTTRVEATVGLVYPRTYLSPLALFGSSAFGDYPANQPILAHNADGEQVEVRTYYYQVTNLDARGIGLGGWMLNRHHAYDPSGRTLLLGSGARRSAADSNLVIRTYAGGGAGGDGSNRRAANLDDVSAVAEGPDGSVYVGTYRAGIIRRISPTGIVGIFAGGHGLGFSGDGGRARDAQLGHIWDLATGPDGSIYLLESSIEAPGANRIRRITSDGIISTVVGGAVNAFYGDGGPATAAAISNAYGIDVGRDGSIFVADTHNHRIRRIGPDGIIATIAGTGVAGFAGDGGAARTAQMYFPRDVAVSADGDVVFDDDANLRIRRIARDGTITTVVGDGTCCFNGDERPATQAKLGGQLGSLSIGRDGTLYISDAIANRRVRFVGPDQIIHTLAGNGGLALPVDGDTAAAAAVLHGFRNFPSNDGGVFIISGPYVVDGRVYKVAPTYPGFDAGDIAIPADDGEELFRFSAAGRHLSTVNTRTGATVLSFGYSAAGELVSIADGDGNITTIEHDPAGHPTAIVSPYGQRTVLSTDGSGFLNRIENSAGEAYLPTHSAGGLLLGVTNPRGYASVYAYDTAGRLIRAEDAAGGSKTLTRVDPPASESDGSNYEVTLRTALNRTTTYKSQTGAVGPLVRSAFRYLLTIAAPDGAVTQTWKRYDGRSETAGPHGTSTMTVRGPDPRFGMQAGLAALSTTVTPGGLTLSIANERAVALADPADPLSLVSQTDTRTINGNRARRVYTSATRMFSFLSPESRQANSTIDHLGRVVRLQTAGLLPTELSYDARGRLASIVHGDAVDERRMTFAYNAQGFLASLTDPLNRTHAFEYDRVGRVTKQILPDLREVAFAYDPNGLVTSVTPPGRPAHGFSYTAVNLEATYDPPLAGLPNASTVYEYDKDRRLALITRPDGAQIDYVYDTAGRLSQINAPHGETSYAYDSAGRVETVTAPGGEVLQYTYDGDLVTSTTWSGTVNGRVSRTYDNDFRVTGITVNDTDTVKFGYDNDGLLTRAGQMTITRDPENGLVTGTTLGNVTDSWTHNGFGEPVHYAARYNGTVIYDLQLTRDKLGRITQKVEVIEGVSHTYDYEYDLAGRLWKVTEDGVLKTPYTYDANGNRLTAPGLTGTPVYDDQDRLIDYDGASYSYTATGEMMAKTVRGHTTTYDYDVFGNLRGIGRSQGDLITYVWDGQHRRIARLENGEPAGGLLYQDASRPVAEVAAGGAIVSRFVYGVSPSHVPAYVRRGDNIYRVVTDHLGSPRLVVNVDSGEVDQRSIHGAWGEVPSYENLGWLPFGFAGGLVDPLSGFLRYGSRDYDPMIGRWTAKDASGFRARAANLYSRTGNDPVNWLDLNGREGSSWQELAEFYSDALCVAVCAATAGLSDAVECTLEDLIGTNIPSVSDYCDYCLGKTSFAEPVAQPPATAEPVAPPSTTTSSTVSSTTSTTTTSTTTSTTNTLDSFGFGHPIGDGFDF